MNQELYRFYITDRAHHAWRRPCEAALAEEYAAKGMTPEERMVDRFERMCKMEIPHIACGEQIAMVRTVSKVPHIFTDAEWEKIEQGEIHELGYLSNVSPNYGAMIRDGLLARREGATEAQKRTIDAIIGLCDCYRETAAKQGRDDLVEVFGQIPRFGARNFREALQFFRVIHYALWLEGEYHNTVGRFDVYMYPYFQKDMDAGVYTRETALELLEDFFLSFNKDSDLYPGVQQGDNGQSMVLGGTDADGNDRFTLLSELCLEASCNLKLIDPKINLRVSKKTPLSVYELGTKLTRAGLGFPQYSNDDVVIEGLVQHGYAYEDAANYVVAACWEFIIPHVGMDIANVRALNFPLVIDRAIRNYLPDGKDFEGLMKQVETEVREECDAITASVKSIWFIPSPFMDLLFDEIKYRNFGMHGCGIANAVDALAAVKKYVYDEKTVTPDRLLRAMDENYENDPELLHLLRYEAPKMGADDETADAISVALLDLFADALEGKKNCFGGIWRAGTGTAMYYLWHARELAATADGRRAGEPFGTNFSPSLFADIADPISVVRSFAKPHMQRVINGGPLTLEFSHGIFAREETLKKVAMLIRYFISLGGHQLQLNTVNPDAMKDAQIHPELHRQLVVRIWGWSAYFVELDREYQEHVMARREYSV